MPKKSNAKILLRIDDLDRDRVNKEYVQDIFDTLNFLEIPWDEGPQNIGEYENAYSQMHRLGLYQKALERLKDSGTVYACTCSRSQIRLNNPDDIYPGTCRDKNIPLDAEDACWRMKTDHSKILSVKTLTGDIIRTTLPAAMHDFVVRKKDGHPAYQLASVIDDLHFEVDMIVRGEDLWHSTLAQIYLSSVLNKDLQSTTFFHHPLLMANDEKKLSKSAGDTSVNYLRRQGKQPADLYSRIAGMFGSSERIKTWRELAALAVENSTSNFI